ncbi:MAG: repressor LexA [Chloroflexi bacterium]|mgnify:CR=1 FL=1|nr:repressor LexA [Chloroflexota bacterium]
MDAELHDHEKRILQLLERSWRQGRQCPSVEEIRQSLQLSSKDHVKRDLDMLESKGYISRRSGAARSIRLLRGAPDSGFDAGGATRSVPVVAKIAAGSPIAWPDSESAVHECETIELSSSLVRSRQPVYALKVQGDSMIDAMICDGDMVIMEPVVDPGLLVGGEILAVWIIDREETTLKKVYLEGDRVKLAPRNPSMQPFYELASNVQLQGKLVTTISQP